MRHQSTEETTKADEAFKKRNWKDAEDSFQRILTRVPEHIEAYLGLSETQAVLGHFSSSLQTLWQAVEVCEQTGQIDRALEIIGRILELKPHHEQALQKRIDLLFSSQRSAEGVAFSRELAQWYLENDDVDAAIRLLLRAFQINPDDLELTLVLAEAYLTNGQMREATGLFRQVIPHFLEAQDWEKAAGIMRRLSLMDPKEPRNFLEMGDLYIKLERYQEADLQFRAVLRIDLNHRQALLKIAEVSLLRKLFRSTSDGSISLIVAAATVGVIVGMVSRTGIGTAVPQAIIPLAAGNLFLGLVAIMTCSLILGMGLPSAVSYLLLATVIGPVFADPQLGVPILAAHMFIFYFGMMAMVTPPVALAAYATASIAQASVFWSSVAAFRYSLVGFTLPFMFVYRPALLLMNESGGGLTIIEALEGQIGRDYSSAFGIVLMTPDDFGYAKKDGADKTEPRVRQNVLLETGMLLSSLTRARMAIIVKGHVEIPSDLQGIIRLGYNDHIREVVAKLCQRLREAGFEIDPSKMASAAQ